MCPVLFLTGTESFHAALLDEAAILARISSARHEFVPDAGHWIHHDQLDAFVARVEEFLTSEE